MRDEQLPRVARALVAIAAPRRERADVLADLAEEARAQASLHGDRFARRWYGRQTMRLVQTYLTGVTTREPITYGGVAIVLLAVVVLAGWLPARRLRRAQISSLLTSGV